MLLTDLAKEWHESDGLLSNLPDYWEVAPSWKQAGIPKKLERGENVGYGLSPVRKVRLWHRHTIFSKKSPHMSATVTQYISSQFAYHLGFPMAPVLCGPDKRDIHSLRMVFNVRSGSVFEVLLDKIKRHDPSVPKELIDIYEDFQSYNRESKWHRVFGQMHLSQAASDVEEIKIWSNQEVDSIYGQNRDAISRWAAFSAFVNSEGVQNPGNVIVSMRDPTSLLYFIDAHPNLQPGTYELGWGHDPIMNDGRFFGKNAQKKGNVDYDVIRRTIEGFKEIMDDDAIDDTIFKTSVLVGRLLGSSRDRSASGEYFRQLRDYYKSRRDTLCCKF